MDAQIRYTISVAALELALSNPNAVYLPLTIDKTVFSQRVLANSGVLSEWSVEVKTDSYIVDTTVAFPTVASFIDFLDTEKKILSFDLADNVNKIIVSIPDSKTANDPDFLKFLETVFPGDAIEISVELPKAPRTSKGFKVEKNKALYFSASTQFFTLKNGNVLELSW